MYLDSIAAAIRLHVPEDRMPNQDAEALFRLYAVLLLTKGPTVTASDVHDIWSAWIAGSDPNHASLVPYADLASDVKQEDQVFVDAIHRAYIEVNQPETDAQFHDILFPSGPPTTDLAYAQTLELYKIIVQSSESLVNRRQAVNTFFLTMNGVILTGLGIIVQNSSNEPTLGGLGVAVLALAGSVLCAAWRSLILSFGQLNQGKFKVINTIERYFTTAIYTAEWEALGKGEDPKIYRAFTSREIWVPNALLGLHIFIVLAAIALTVRRI